MVATEKKITIRLPLASYHRLQQLARRTGKTPESLVREIVERALEERASPAPPPPRTARQILEAAERVRPLSPALQERIIPGVTLEEVRTTLDEAGGPSLSAIILQQRQIPS